MFRQFYQNLTRNYKIIHELTYIHIVASPLSLRGGWGGQKNSLKPPLYIYKAIFEILSFRQKRPYYYVYERQKIKFHLIYLFLQHVRWKNLLSRNLIINYYEKEKLNFLCLCKRERRIQNFNMEVLYSLIKKIHFNSTLPWYSWCKTFLVL